MSNPYFEGQYTNFFAAYIAAFVGFKLYERDGFFSFSAIMTALSIIVFVYILKTTINKLKLSISNGESSLAFGIAKYIFEMSACFIMCIFLIELADMAKKFWKLRLF